MHNQPQQPSKTQAIKSILCNECKNEFKTKPRSEARDSTTGEEGAKIGDKVQCPTCGTTLTIISVDEKGTGKTRPVPEEK